MIRKGKKSLRTNKSRGFEHLVCGSDGAGIKGVEEKERGSVVLLSVTWKNPRSIILSETCQAQEEKYCAPSSTLGNWEFNSQTQRWCQGLNLQCCSQAHVLSILWLLVLSGDSLVILEAGLCGEPLRVIAGYCLQFTSSWTEDCRLTGPRTEQVCFPDHALMGETLWKHKPSK